MYTNEYMYAIERSDDYLAHYGIKGMRWGVRKAIASGSERRMARAYNKAAKKLAKLEKRAVSGKKYARRAAALGAGAAAAGGLAVAGTKGVGSAIRQGGHALGNAYAHGSYALGKGMQGIGKKLTQVPNQKIANVGLAIRGAGRSITKAGENSKHIVSNMTKAGNAVSKWGKATSSISPGLQKAAENIYAHRTDNRTLLRLSNQANKALKANGQDVISKQIEKLGKVSNNTVARIGAGAVGAGLAAGAGYNAYRAATTKRAAKKAAQWRSEMNKAFAGTQYANGNPNPNAGKKKKRR